MKPQRIQTPPVPANLRLRDLDVVTDEKLIARALQRWESEGGRILGSPDRANAAQSKGAR